MHDSMPHDPIQCQIKITGPLNFPLSPPPLTVLAGK